jgi:hypothetical protein
MGVAGLGLIAIERIAPTKNPKKEITLSPR